MRSLILLLTLARPAAAADVHALLEQLGDPSPAVHDKACKELIAAGQTAAGVLNANLHDEAANAHHRVSYIVDRAEGTKAPGDAWDRSRNVIEGRPEVWLEGSTKHVRVTEGKRRVHIIEGSGSIRIEVDGDECGGTSKETYTGRDPQELVHKHYGAWDIYMRWGGGVGTRWSVEGHTLTGKRFTVNKPIIRRTVMRNFDVLRDWVRGQMAAAKPPKKKQRRVEKLLTAGVAALASTGTNAEKVRAFLRVSDDLRRAMAAAGLPGPRELLPPPEHVRLGVTASETPEGVRVDSVVPGSRGAELGIRIGDIILTVQGRSLPRRGLSRAIRAVGEARLSVEILRGGTKVKLEERKGRRR